MPLPNTPPNTFFSPLSQPRIWVILLWSLTLSAIVAGFLFYNGVLRDEAARQTILLVPTQPPDDNQRAELRRVIEAEPGVASAAWIAPADQARRIQTQFPDESWREAFPANESWLPWVLEVSPANPLNARDQLTGFIAQRKQDGGWQVFWDGSRLDTLIDRYNTARIVSAVFLVLILMAGTAALLQLPRSPRPIAEIAESTVLSVLAFFALWSAAWVSGAGVGGDTLASGAAAAFILACVVAPMLRLRRIPNPVPASTFSTTVTEAPDERIR